MGLAGHQHTDAVIYLGRKNKSFGRAEWQTNFYFRRYLEARREKNRTILPHDATEFDFLHILFNYNWSVVTGRV